MTAPTPILVRDTRSPWSRPPPGGSALSGFVVPDDLVIHEDDGGRIVLIVMDGIGGLPGPSGLTELEAAATPNLDALAARSSLGILDPVAPGVTPGSGPGHLALFGYDPLHYRIGRGALSALGVGFDLQPGDVAVRLNLATMDANGNVTDRRAGRPVDAEGQRIVEKVRAALRAPDGVRVWVEPVKEHRAALVVRGPGLWADLEDTDPQETGVPPHPMVATASRSEPTAALMRDLLAQARAAIADEPVINGILARGFARHESIPSMRDRFGLHATAVARYPMYRGVARLVGMSIEGVPAGDTETVEQLESLWGGHDFSFLHFKATDARGEDGDFDAKVAAAEAIDALIPRVMDLEPDVVLVTGDHSTPATYAAHSWHGVPILIASRWCRPTASTFGERHCRVGDLGRFSGKHLMSLALAHAGRLEKFGA